MSERKVFVDTLKRAINQHPEKERGIFREKIKRSYINNFLNDIENIIDRAFEPPSIGIIDLENTKYGNMLQNSIKCYDYGYYYSTIATCGITAERACMDLLLRHELRFDGRLLVPSELEILFKIPHTRLVELLFHWNTIGKDVKNKLMKINDKRNEYVHPDVVPEGFSISERKQLKKDALEVLTLLKEIIKTMYSL